MQLCKKYKEYFIQALYNEIDADALDNLQGHLEKCAECRKEFSQMKSTIKQINPENINDPGDQFWENYWTHLEERMEEENVQKDTGVKRNNIFILHPNVRIWAVRILSAAAMLLIGVGIGYLYFGNSNQMGRTLSGQIPVKKTAYPKEAADYLERSKILLLGFVNFDTDKTDPTTMDFSRQQEVAGSLVKQAAVLKEDLKGRDNQRIVALIQELEVIFLQISNYDKKFDTPAVDIIKGGVDNNAILMKINLEEIMRASSKEDNQSSEKEKPTKTGKEL